MSVVRERVAAAYLAACRAEIAALKPGNVHRFAPGHGMAAAHFEESARATAGPLTQAGAPLGMRVRRSVEASFSAVGLNTNLGILLLCAPLAMAGERLLASGGGLAGLPEAADALSAEVRRVLERADLRDASNVYAAIAEASPGGLGAAEAPEADVRHAPALPLAQAMAMASGRDLVARQYADGFAEIFGMGVAASGDRLSPLFGDPAFGPAALTFLTFAAAFPDSHVARKHGPDPAEALRAEMARFAKRLISEKDFRRRFDMALSFDADLKRRGLNPGTSADLTVASLFARLLAEQALR